MSAFIPMVYLALGFALGLYVRRLKDRIGRLSMECLNQVYFRVYGPKLKETIPSFTRMGDE